MTKRKRDPNWRDRQQAQLDWYSGVLGTLRRLILEGDSPMPESMLPCIPWEQPQYQGLVIGSSWLRQPACTQRVLQLDWVEAKVAS